MVNFNVNGIVIAGISVFLLGCWILVRRADLKKRHRSFAQWLIYAIRRLSQWLWAVHVGFDVGYLRYRQTLARCDHDMENERELGLVVGKAGIAEQQPA